MNINVNIIKEKKIIQMIPVSILINIKKDPISFS